jgi:hypothetical protein
MVEGCRSALVRVGAGGCHGAGKHVIDGAWRRCGTSVPLSRDGGNSCDSADTPYARYVRHKAGCAGGSERIAAQSRRLVPLSRDWLNCA